MWTTYADRSGPDALANFMAAKTPTFPPTVSRRRRLIEVAFPLEEVSAHSRREKMSAAAIDQGRPNRAFYF